MNDFWCNGREWLNFMAIAKNASRLCIGVSALLAVASCSTDKAPTDAESAAAGSDLPVPEYSERDGDLFMYVGERSEEDVKQGIRASVFTYRYLGLEDAIQKLELVDDNGSRLGLYECATPCRVAKSTSPFGQVSRIAIEPTSIIAAAFRDASNGFLTLSNPPAEQKLHQPRSMGQTVSTVNGAQDYRGNKGKCSLVISGKTYIAGACWVRLEEDGSFQIMSQDESYFAQLSRSGNEASGFWNGSRGSTHAQTTLGAMTRDGACWKSADAAICAWADR